MKPRFDFRLLLIPALILGLFASSCKKDDPDPADPPPAATATFKLTLPSGPVTITSAPTPLYSWSGDGRTELAMWTIGDKTFKIIFSRYFNDGTGSGGDDPTDAEQDSMFAVGAYPFGWGTYSTTQVLAYFSDGTNHYYSDGYQDSSSFVVTSVTDVTSTEYRKQVEGTFNVTLRVGLDSLVVTDGEFRGRFAVPGH